MQNCGDWTSSLMGALEKEASMVAESQFLASPEELDREFTFCFFLKTSGLKNICYFFAPLKQCNIFQGDSQVVCFQARLYCQWILPLLALQFTSPIPVLGSLDFVYQPPRPTSSFLPNLLLLSTCYPFFQ